MAGKFVYHRIVDVKGESIAAFSHLLRGRLIRRAILRGLLSLGFAGVGAPGDEVIKLPPYVLSTPLDTLAFPYRQFCELKETPGSETFTLSEYVILKHRDSTFAAPVQHILRGPDGKSRLELKSESGIHAIDARYGDYIASSNQPADFSSFYFLLRATCLRDKSGLTKQTLKKLLDDYTRFADQRIAFAKKFYGARKQDEFADVRTLVTPDEIIVFLRREETARELGGRLKLEVDGRAVRIPKAKLDALMANRGVDPLAELPPDAVECVTPWRHAESLPEVLDGASLFVVGWIIYRPYFFAHERKELLMIGQLRRR